MVLDSVLARYGFQRKEPLVDNIIDSDLDISDPDY